MFHSSGQACKSGRVSHHGRVQGHEDAGHERGRLLRWLHRDHGTPRGGDDPGEFEPAAVEQVLRVADRFFGPGKYFELQVDGLEHVPPAPAMLVSNHSGGTTIPDVWGLVFAW